MREWTAALRRERMGGQGRKVLRDRRGLSPRDVRGEGLPAEPTVREMRDGFRVRCAQVFILGLRVSVIKRKPAVFRVVVMLAMPMVIPGLSVLPFGRAGIAQEVKFTEEYLTDPKNIELGKTVWLKRCKFCHGKSGYPGKAPKLQPSRYKPEFVYERVTNGFRGMPAWQGEFSEEERKAVVSYVMSNVFSR